MSVAFLFLYSKEFTHRHTPGEPSASEAVHTVHSPRSSHRPTDTCCDSPRTAGSWGRSRCRGLFQTVRASGSTLPCVIHCRGTCHRVLCQCRQQRSPLQSPLTQSPTSPSLLSLARPRDQRECATRPLVGGLHRVEVMLLPQEASAHHVSVHGRLQEDVLHVWPSSLHVGSGHLHQCTLHVLACLRFRRWWMPMRT
jgi:hypothetical protein